MRSSIKIRGQGLQKFLPLSAVIILYAFFAIFGRNFFSADTLVNILDQSYYIGYLAIGVTFVIITSGIDLSIGTVMMCSALLGGVAYNTWKWPITVCLLFIFVVSTLFGLLNGFFIAKLKLPPFIGTLGTMDISMGLGAIISNVTTQRYPTMYDPDGWFKRVFFKTQGGFPMGILFLALFFVIGWFLLNKSKLGRYTYAIGSNEEATRLSGINADKWKMIIYTLAGFCCGLSAIAYAADFTTIIPGTGNGIEMNAIAAVVIGGTSLAGGIGTLSGSIIGVYIMSILSNGLMSMNLQGQWQTFFMGVVIVLAVLLDVYRNKKANEVRISRDDRNTPAEQMKQPAESPAENGKVGV